MRHFQAKLPTGYKEQTYASPYWIVRYPHQLRMQTAMKAILASRPAVLVDYGAGDGHLLFDAIEGGFAGRIVAYEPVERFWRQIIAEGSKRGHADRVELVTGRAELQGPFNFVACLGVLEHMPLPERESFYDLCRTELAEDGQVLIDVPVEIGPTLLVKNVGRRLLKGRAREYGWGELLRSTAGIRRHDPARNDPRDTRTWIHDHKGFDYRLLEEEIRNHGFRITKRQSTPLGCLPAPFFNQELFLTVCL